MKWEIYGKAFDTLSGQSINIYVYTYGAMCIGRDSQPVPCLEYVYMHFSSFMYFMDTASKNKQFGVIAALPVCLGKSLGKSKLQVKVDAAGGWVSV
jgi:hypothetical protein